VERQTVLDPNLAAAQTTRELPQTPLSTTDLEDIERATIRRVFEQVKGDQSSGRTHARYQPCHTVPQAEALQHRHGIIRSGSSSHTLQ
jgi:hypothetical protein